MIPEPDELILPNRVSVDFYDEYMHISRRWWGLSTVFLLVFMGFWVFIVSFVFENAFSGSPKGISILFSIIFGLASCSLVYSTTANLLNKTDIFVSQQRMEIKISPIPWRGNKKVLMDDIEQFYVKTRVTGPRNKRRTVHELRYIERNGVDYKLLEGFGSKQNLQFVERQIEKYLGIKDQRLAQEETEQDF